MFFYMGFFRFEGARVPHRLCIKAVHPLRKGVTGATRVPRPFHPDEKNKNPQKSDTNLSL